MTDKAGLIERLHKFSPPFEIYHGETEIGDTEGHVCTAENPEIAKAILAALATQTTVMERVKEALEQINVENERAIRQFTSANNTIIRRWVREALSAIQELEQSK